MSLKLHNDDYLYVPRAQGAYPIKDSDLKRLEKMISGVNPQTRSLHNLALVAIGVTTNAAFCLLASVAASNTPYWVWGVNWGTFFISIALAVIFWQLDKKREKSTEFLLQDVLREIEQLKGNFYLPKDKESVSQLYIAEDVIMPSRQTISILRSKMSLLGSLSDEEILTVISYLKGEEKRNAIDCLECATGTTLINPDKVFEEIMNHLRQIDE